jgi:GT2 family glycosyltransferase
MPELSILIVAYHSQGDLEGCLPSLSLQSYRDFEIVIVNNSPEDVLATWLAQNHPQVKLVDNPTNTGYAGGNNLGLQTIHSNYVLFLNPDTVLEPDALETLMNTARQHPDAMLNPMLLAPGGNVNACGLEMHVTGITTCRGLGQHPARFLTPHPIPLLSGAALLVPTQLLKKLGGFNQSYFMYLEDVELSLRAKLLGVPLLCEPGAKIHHAYKAAVSPSKFFYLERNRWLTLLRLCEKETLRGLMPALVLTELMTWGYALLRGPRFLLLRFQVYTSLWSLRKTVRAQRESVQRERCFPDEVWLEDCLTVLPFEQLVSSQRLANVLQQVSQFFYVRPQNLERSS